MAKIYVLSDRPVKEFMSTAVVTVGEDDSIEDLVWKFQRYKYAGFPVVNDQGQIIGMVRDSDILKLFVMTRPHSILAETAKDVMRVPPHTIPPDASAQKAVEQMFDANVRLLAVTDKKKKLLGIISREDLVTGIFSKRRTEEWPTE
ncbi:MAG: CBS domain-containing protein [Actinomycetota bacterium]|nr:CBS domain-containing protein [Actinomycetota bacterium]